MDESGGKHPLLGKTSLALLVMTALLAVPYADRRLERLRVWNSVPSAETEITAARAAADPSLAPTVGEQALKATTNEGTITNALPEKSAEREELDPAVLARLAGSLAVEDPSGRALDAFYRALTRTERKDPGAVTRVLHYGDSLITADLISGTMRRRMQGRFGDSGHGFILTANPWEWYFHNDVSHSATDGFSANRITGPFTGDGMYGLGGVTFHAKGATSATFGTARKGSHGRNVSRFDLYYLEQPAGGDATLHVQGRAPERLSTRGPKKVSKVHSLQVPDGEAQMTLKTLGNGDVRTFGVALERSEPGVVYDALGVNGARMRLLEGISAEHWAEQMALRKPALVLFQYGTNESENNMLDLEAYETSLRTVLGRVKGAASEASILVVAPLDRAEKRNGAVRTRPIIPKIVAVQRKVAHALGLGFWDTFTAMGGEGSMAKWVTASPQLGTWDFTHPTPAGADLLGEMLFQALETGYRAYVSRAAETARAGVSPR